MKELKYMSFKEMYEEFGFILDLRYVSNIFKDEKISTEFYSKLNGISLYGITENDFTRDFFMKHANEVDKEAFVFYSLKTMLENKQAYKADKVEKCKQALKKSHFACYELDKDSDNWSDIKRITAKELVTGERDEEFDDNINMKRVMKISEEINLLSLFNIGSINEIDKYYGNNSNLNMLLIRMSLINALDSLTPLTDQEKRSYLSDSKYQELFSRIEAQREDYYTKVDMKKFYEKFPEYLRKYPECFDIDKVFLITASRVNQYLETEALDDEQRSNLTKVLVILRDSIDAHNLKLTGLKGINPVEGDVKSYSYRELVDACKRITKNGEYISLNREKELKENLLDDPSKLAMVDPEIIRVMKFSNEEYSRLFDGDENIYYLISNDLISKTKINDFIKDKAFVESNEFVSLVENGYISEQQARKAIADDVRISSDLLFALKNGNLIGNDDIMAYYLKGNIDVDTLNSMPEEKKKEFSERFSIRELMNLYKDQSSEEEYIKYVVAYRTIVLAEKSKEEKEDVAEEIIEQIGLNLEDEDLVNLYKEHLIPIKTVESWGGPQLITDMMKQALLKPIDVKEICSDGNYESVLSIMKDVNIPRKNKLAIFYTTFADEDDSLTEDQKILRELAKSESLKYMNLTDKAIKGRKSTGITRTRGEGKEKRKEYVSDPLNRWTLIKLIDPEYSYEMLDQGMMIFKLPNYNKIILEKMFRKEQPEYGRATKVLDMSVEEFEKVKSQLIVEGDIPVQAVNYHPVVKDKCKSIEHSTSWGKRIADIFGYDKDVNRSKENIDKIDLEIKKIIESRKDRGNY